MKGKQMDPEVETKMMENVVRWAKVADNARYLSVEHRHKEKEYGIKWREAYKLELKKEEEELRRKFGQFLDEGTDLTDPNHIIAAIVTKDWKDVRTFTKAGQFDLILLMCDNLNAYEVSLNYLRSILKDKELWIKLEEK